MLLEVSEISPTSSTPNSVDIHDLKPVTSSCLHRASSNKSTAVLSAASHDIGCDEQQIPNCDTTDSEAACEPSQARRLTSDVIYAWHRQQLSYDKAAAIPQLSLVQRSNPPELLARQHTTLFHVPSSDLVDPFSTLPIEVDYTTNELLHFYLGSNTAYWSSAYGLSRKVKPSLKSAWESFMPCAEHFHILMARSALHQLRINSNLEPALRINLRLSSIAHQGKALASLRQKVARGLHADQHDVFVAVLSIATFEQRYGQKKKARLHFDMGRMMLRSLGRQHNAEDRRKETQALWFEGIYTAPNASFMWSPADLSLNHGRLTQLLKSVDQIWRSWQNEPALVRRAGSRKRFVSSKSRLHELLHRDCKGQLLSIYQDIDQDVAQTRCLLICVAVITGLWATETKVRSSKNAVHAIHAWTQWVENSIHQAELDVSSAMPDLLWIMLQDPCLTHPPLLPPSTAVQPHDDFEAERRRGSDFDIQECHWRVAGVANAMKYLATVWRRLIRAWLLAFLDGAVYDGELVVDSFAFSYAAGQTA